MLLIVDAIGFISYSFNLERPQERTWWANALRMIKVSQRVLFYVAYYSVVSEPIRVDNIQFELHKTDIFLVVFFKE